MEMTGQRVLAADRATVWRALNDPQVLKASIPGCEAIEKIANNEYAVTVGTTLGPVRAKFRGKLSLEDVVPPESYTLRFEGEGGAAGFAKGSSKVTLAEDGGKTTLGYSVAAQIGGRIAQVGNRLVDSAARKLADDFFTAFEKAVPGTTPPKEQPAPFVQNGVPIGRYIAMAMILAALVASIGYTLR
jgi:carbon monoxide dehydrogenase subunit G